MFMVFIYVKIIYSFTGNIYKVTSVLVKNLINFIITLYFCINLKNKLYNIYVLHARYFDVNSV